MYSNDIKISNYLLSIVLTDGQQDFEFIEVININGESRLRYSWVKEIPNGDLDAGTTLILYDVNLYEFVFEHLKQWAFDRGYFIEYSKIFNSTKNFESGVTIRRLKNTQQGIIEEKVLFVQTTNKSELDAIIWGVNWILNNVSTSSILRLI